MLKLYPAAVGSITAEALRAAVWVDLIEPTPEESALVAAALGLATPTREALSEIESSSRLQVDGDLLRLSSPLLAHAETPEQTLTPVGFVVSPRALLTVRFTPLRAFEAVHDKLPLAPEIDAPAVFTLLLEGVVDRDADLLEHVAEELEAISRAVFRADPRKRGEGIRNDASLRQTLSAVGRIGDRLSEIRATLHGLGRIVPFACQVGVEWIGPGDLTRLNAVRQDIASLDDFHNHLATKSQFLLDAVLGFINTQQNELFKVLTIVSVVGVPPTLFASIWGMNFHHMPELAWRGGYPMAVVLIVASGVIPMLWFKWKRWW